MMKKTILTFSILISSPIFNIFAIGGNNIIEIAPSPIDELQAIANNASKSEKERLDACKKLMNLSENAKKIAIPILFNMVHQSTDEKSKTKALQELWYDEKYKESHCDELVSQLWDIVRNTKNEKNKINALNKLFRDEKLKKSHYDVLISLLWDFVQNVKDEKNKIDALYLLFNDEESKKSHYDQLVSLLWDLVKHTKNDKSKCKALITLFGDEKCKETYYDELVSPLWELVQHTQNKNIKISVVITLRFDQKAKTKYLNELTPMLLNLTQNNLNERLAYYTLSTLWRDKEIKAEHRNILILIILEFARNAQEENAKSNALYMLWDDPATKEVHRAELVATYFELFRNTQDEVKKDHYRSVLWSDPATKEAHRAEFVAAYFELFRNTQDEIKKAEYFLELWTDIPTKEAHRAEFVAAYLDFFLNTLDETDKYFHLFELWVDKQTKEGHRDALVKAILTYFKNLQNEVKDTFLLNLLWFDPETKKNYHTELIASFLELFRNTQDEVKKDQYLSVLWNNEPTREAHREELANAYLELLRNTQDETKKAQYLAALWSDQKIRAKHLHELIASHIDLVQDASQKWIRDKSFNALNTDIADRQIFNEQHKEIFEAAQERMKSEALQEQKLENYLRDGDIYQEEFQTFITNYWAHLHHETKIALCQKYVIQFGEDNPRIQELLLLYARDGSPRDGAVNVYADLLLKLKDSFVHHPSVLDIKLDIENAQSLHFAINPEIFNYLPVNQEALATLEDVNLILGDDIDPQTKGILDNTDPRNYGADFRKYFVAPFSEESMMLQAIIQKYKRMGLKGKEKLTEKMSDFLQCKQGKDQAIGVHYLVESEALPFAELKNIADWLVRLQDNNNPYINDADLKSSFNKSRVQMIALVSHMLKPDHIFRRHLTDLQTEEAQLLKALLGSVVKLEKHIDLSDRVALGQNLKLALDILVKLLNEEKFFETLTELCEMHDIYLPANKFGDQLSDGSIEGLIQKLKSSDVEERGDLLTFQNQMRDFIKSESFKALLNNFDVEEGAKLRELIRGYVSNTWPVGLLNLMELARGEKLEDAVNAILDQTKIDKDMPLTWANLKNMLTRELLGVKRQTINALVENITGLNHATRPHDIWYVEGLLGGIVGLRHADKMPNFDIWHMTHENTTSKSLQETLDLFHENFTANRIINHVKEMINTSKLSITAPGTGENIIWDMIRVAAKEQLRDKEIAKSMSEGNIIDEVNIEEQVNDLLYNQTGATHLAVGLLLTKLGILSEINEDDHVIVDNNVILD